MPQDRRGPRGTGPLTKSPEAESPLSYKVLALKYRPTSFDEVVGQTTVTRTLQNALERGKIGLAFLLSGARGVGKTTTARIPAKALNCARARPPPRACSTRDEESRAAACSSCREIADGRSLDVQEIDGASNTGVDSIRELREMTRFSPARDRFRIWIIDEVHQISGAAFNALLKTLEEPPPRVKFIFATTEYHKIPETILSRCQQFDFRMIPARELSLHLRHVADAEKIRVTEAALGLVARAAEGSVRDALSLFDQVLAFSGDEVKDEDVAGLLGLVDRELLHRASRAIVEGSSLAMLELVESLADYGADYRGLRELLLHLREILLRSRPRGRSLLAGVLQTRAAARARGGALTEELLAVRPADAGRDRVQQRHRSARGARPRAAEARADAEAGAFRRGGGARRADAGRCNGSGGTGSRPGSASTARQPAGSRILFVLGSDAGSGPPGRGTGSCRAAPGGAAAPGRSRAGRDALRRCSTSASRADLAATLRRQRSVSRPTRWCSSCRRTSLCSRARADDYKALASGPPAGPSPPFASVSVQAEAPVAPPGRGKKQRLRGGGEGTGGCRKHSTSSTGGWSTCAAKPGGGRVNPFGDPRKMMKQLQRRRSLRASRGDRGRCGSGGGAVKVR